ncbi:MAG: hypothetical protein ACI8RZ_002470 [Myxococcota bacterium]|jgi:hypothetical protein
MEPIMTRLSLIALIALSSTGCELIDDSEFENTEETCDDVSKVTFYADADGDGYGSDLAQKEACEAPAGYIADGGDCDDEDSEISPDADEVCDGVDNNCDDITDEDATDTAIFYADSDSDGYGDEALIEESCEASSGYIAEAGDCDDTDASVAEICTVGLRFANIRSDNPDALFSVEDADGNQVFSESVSQLDSTGYIEVDRGTYDIVMSMEGTELWRASDFPFNTAGDSYTTAAISNYAIIKRDIYEDLSAGEFRLNLTNTDETAVEYAAGLQELDSGDFQVVFNQSLNINEELIEVLSTPELPLLIEVVWPLTEGGYDVRMDWVVTDGAVDADGSLLFGWFHYTGVCLLTDSSTCAAEMVTLDENGTVMSFPINSMGWTPQ